jgi:ribonuclease HI
LVFFDGSSQGNPPIGKVGEVPFLHCEYVLRFKVVLERGSNNLVELMALKFPITLVAEKIVHHIQIFGDSLVVIVGK